MSLLTQMRLVIGDYIYHEKLACCKPTSPVSQQATIRGITPEVPMRIRSLGLSAVGLLTLLAGSLLRAETQSAFLVSTEWLAKNASDPNLVILHVGFEKDYAEGHIPGARLVKLDDISVTGHNDLRLQLPPTDKLREALGKLGITNRSRIVVYPYGESIQSATRVWFTLDYAGLSDKASLLDGGLLLWKAENRPVSTEAVPPAAGAAGPQITPHPEKVADADWIRERLKDPKLDVIDARAPEFYTGENKGPWARPGHIEGARNVPFPSLLDSQRKLKPEAELRSAMVKEPGKQIVSYCHIGQQATVVYFVARYLGLSPKLYDGSFQEWASRSELPVATGAAPLGH
jgi:thiosulfate/3-mercaptopyruvate sulfurtransferase